MKAEVTIDENLCQGCGYCVVFCSQHCFELTGENFTSQGYLLPSFAKPDDCTGCGVCAWMCPAVAIEVYKYKPEYMK